MSVRHHAIDARHDAGVSAAANPQASAGVRGAVPAAAGDLLPGALPLPQGHDHPRRYEALGQLGQDEPAPIPRDICPI